MRLNTLYKLVPLIAILFLILSLFKNRLLGEFSIETQNKIIFALYSVSLLFIGAGFQEFGNELKREKEKLSQSNIPLLMPKRKDEDDDKKDPKNSFSITLD